ncbi:MAG: hypothetical protein WAN50_04785 [Minisyncoccia bacterium]
MRKQLALIAVFILVAPAAFLSAPRPAHAQLGVPVADFLTEGSTLWSKIAHEFLDALQFEVSSKLIQSITGSVVNFVNNPGNNSSPMYVQNLSQLLQNIGDTQANAFLTQFMQNSNSPFASSIVSSLRTNYLQNTGTGGFWVKNQCTLNPATINDFLAGDWTKGGVSAWLALTTQDQNNPFMLYQNSQNQLASLVGGAQSTKQQQLNWGQGFMSWCGGGSTNVSSAGGPCGTCPGGQTCSQTGMEDGKPSYACESSTAVNAVAPVQCVNADGSEGTVDTPGSVIVASLNKSLGANVDKIVSANQINDLISDLMSSILNKVIGGVEGGLFGSTQPSSGSGSSSLIEQYVNSAPTQTASSSASSAANSVVNDTIANINSYESAWNTVLSAANAAESAVRAAGTACAANASVFGGGVTAAQAQAALDSEITPVITQAQTSISTAEATRQFAAKVNAESSPTTQEEITTFSTDLSTLMGDTPTAADVQTAQGDAQTTGQAKANPVGSLTVSGGTLQDQMNLITANANAAAALCAPATSNPVSGDGGG